MPSATATTGTAALTATFSTSYKWKNTSGTDATTGQVITALATQDGDVASGYISVTPDALIGDAFSESISLTNCGFSIPSGAVGICAQVILRHRKTGGSGFSVYEVKLIVGGSVVGADMSADEVVSSTTYTDLTIGSSSMDSSGAAPTRTQVNAANFGARITYAGSQNSGGGPLSDLRLERVQIVVNYTDGGGRRRVVVSRFGG
jgi:hypothetical protein